jgi:hypothetical protein
MDSAISRPPSPNSSHPQLHQQNGLKTDLGKELTIAFGNIGFNVGGLLLGIGYTDMVAAPPTREQVEATFRAVCHVFNETSPLNNSLSCNVTDLRAVEVLFPDAAKVSMISGSSFMAAAIVVVFSYIFYKRQTADQEKGILVSPTREFMRRTVNTFSNTLFLMAGIQMGVALPNYIGDSPSLPPSQQLLNGICEFFPESSNSTMLCNMNQLKLVAALFVQPRTTILWIGGAIIVGMLFFVLTYALCRSLSSQGTEETNESTPLHFSDNELPVENDRIDDLIVLVEED